MKTQRGFTLIELIIVIIILGVLSAVAVPKFMDMSGSAHNAAARGIAGAIASATAVNYAARAAGAVTAVPVNQNNATVCTAAVLGAFVQGTIRLVNVTPTNDSEFLVSAGVGDCSAVATSSLTCGLTAQGGTVQEVTVMCAH